MKVHASTLPEGEHRPVCCECDRIITEERCYAVDPDDIRDFECVCRTCFGKIWNALPEGVIKDTIAEDWDKRDIPTPRSWS